MILDAMFCSHRHDPSRGRRIKTRDRRGDNKDQGERSRRRRENVEEGELGEKMGTGVDGVDGGRAGRREYRGNKEKIFRGRVMHRRMILLLSHGVESFYYIDPRLTKISQKLEREEIVDSHLL